MVRFNQTDNPTHPQLSTALTDPNGDGTGRLVYHPILRNENLDGIAPDFDNFSYTEWADGAYTQGSTVAYSDKYYVATVDIIAGEKPGENVKWLERGNLDAYLQERRREAIRTAVMTCYNDKKARHVARETLGNMLIYEGAGRMEDLIIKKVGRLVGFQIEILNNDGIEIILQKLSLQLTQAQSLNVYLWHNSQTDPIATIAITHNKVSSVEWHDIPAADGTLKFMDLANDFDSGIYYLGYYEDDLTGQAIRKRFTFGVQPCASCSRHNVTAYKKYSQYVRITTFEVGAPPAAQQLWDITKMAHTVDTNYGMNLRIASGCNITQYLIDRREVFADLIAEQLKYDLIIEIANSTRSNVLTEQTMKQARGILQQTDLGGEGLKDDLMRSRSAAALEIADIHANVCMPKVNITGVRSANIKTQPAGWPSRRY